MTRTGAVKKIAVVTAFCVGVFNYGTKRSACQLVAEHTRKNLREIFFFSGSCRFIFARSTACHLSENSVKINLKSCRKSVNYNSDSVAVAFAENGNFYLITVGRGHSPYLQYYYNLCKNQGNFC